MRGLYQNNRPDFRFITWYRNDEALFIPWQPLSQSGIYKANKVRMGRTTIPVRSHVRPRGYARGRSLGPRDYSLHSWAARRVLLTQTCSDAHQNHALTLLRARWENLYSTLIWREQRNVFVSNSLDIYCCDEIKAVNIHEHNLPSIPREHRIYQKNKHS